MENNTMNAVAGRKRRKTIFHFLNYREYLDKLFEQHLEKDKRFSYRAFARMAGSTSPNFLQLISSGRLRISEKQALTLSENAGLKPKEIEYFNALIRFDHADSHDERNSAFHHILSLRESRTVNHLADNQYTYLSNWYNPVVRELICSSTYPDDPNWVVDRIVPTIGLREVKKSIALLNELGLVERNRQDNGWISKDNTISTPEEVMSLSVIEYHRSMLERASESMELFPAHLRDLRSVTMGISKEQLPELKAKLTSFWNELMLLADSVDDAEMVVQVNTQLFPFTVIEEEL